MFKYLSMFSIIAIVTLSTQRLSAQEPSSEDPYLWLEEVEGNQALDWVRSQNKASAKVLEADPLYDELQQKFRILYNDRDKIAYPKMVGDLVFNFWQDDQYERGIWRSMPINDYLKNKSNWKTLFNLDEISATENKKWVFKQSNFLTPVNDLCLITLSDGGKDEAEVREFDIQKNSFVNNGFFFPESKGDVAWMDKNKILAARNFGPGTMTSSGYPRQAKIISRGQAVEEAQTVFETDSTNLGIFPISIFDKGTRHVLIYESPTIFETILHYYDGENFQKLNFPIDANFQDIHRGELIFSLQSDWKPNDITFKKGSLVSLNLKENLNGELNVKVIYEPNNRSSFVSMSKCKDFIVVNTMENVQNKLYKVTFRNGEWNSESINSPEFGSVDWLNTSIWSNHFFFSFSNFITPTTLYFSQGAKIKRVKQLKEFFNTDNLVVKQYNATSKDKTQVPYFIVHHKDLRYNGQNPTLIYAYGGFNVPNQPNYSATTGIGWLEKGGVYVLANIRGGGEFGPSWHQDAMKEKKQNSYDDFYAVTEDLINRKITSPQYLGAFGGSNGGLMAGVLFTQRPDLYNAVCMIVPLLDMKRYSKMLAGASWMGEYGNPDIPEEWAYISKYSPYHNLSKDKDYPEVYFVTSTKDDRVHPGHARKMAAKMEEMGLPYLYHETIEGGHGAASTTAQQADMWAGIFTYFNIKLHNEPLEKK